MGVDDERARVEINTLSCDAVNSPVLSGIEQRKLR
jgi:hypothetical protein